jgi:DNA-binding transcriptional MerR regulator
MNRFPSLDVSPFLASGFCGHVFVPIYVFNSTVLFDSVLKNWYNTVMNEEPTNLWTIEELTDRVAIALAVGYEGVASGRVRDVPDLRTIRYYATIGLLDRPAEMRGRTAFYGTRHLRQLVAIKRLQAQGLKLADIQQRLVGLTEQALRRFVDPLTTVPEPSGTDRADSFWRNSRSSDTEYEGAQSTGDRPVPEIPNKIPPALAYQTEQRVLLDDGAILALATRRPMENDDLRVIRMAAAPLIELLKLRGLIGPSAQGEHR